MAGTAPIITITGTNKAMPSFIDIHTHILPGIDDGPGGMEESLSILREAEQAGVKEIVLTPHYPYTGPDLGSICNGYECLKEEAGRQGIGIALHLGAELKLSPELPEMVMNDKRLTFDCKGRYILVELPSFEIPFYAANIFFNLMIKGITPVWAHPERCQDVGRDPSVVKSFVNSGVQLQLNAGSLLGDYGRKAKNAAVYLVENMLVNFIASDTHGRGNIGKVLPEAYSYVEKKAGSFSAEEMFHGNQSRLF